MAEGLATLLNVDIDSVLWALVYCQCGFHVHPEKGDRSAEDALNRLARSCIGERLRAWLSPSTCAIREAIYYPDDKVSARHDRVHPFILNLPIVILELDDELFVVEGNTRVNAWRSLKSNPARKDVDHVDIGLEAVVLTPQA